MVFRSIITLTHSIFVSVSEITSCHRYKLGHRGKTTNATFEEFKGKDSLFVSEWLRQKGLEKPLRGI